MTPTKIHHTLNRNWLLRKKIKTRCGRNIDRDYVRRDKLRVTCSRCIQSIQKGVRNP